MPPKISTEATTKRRVTSSAKKSTPMQAVTGGMASWTYDHEHGFQSTTRYNTLLGPVIKYAEAGNHSFAISTDSESNAYKEILTQYQSNDCDPKWEAYEYNKPI